jgi:hypothetical protein
MVENVADLSGMRCVCIGDWELDRMSLIHPAAQLKHRVDWLVRTRYDRILPEDVGKLIADVLANKPMGQVNVYW